jgi:uncharacterized membrane protein YgaE (UPF0421/DUF939 family)
VASLGWRPALRLTVPSYPNRLRTWGFGEQAFKAALAAGIAWVVGGLVPGAPPAPYLAPLTAMLSVQLTIAESVTGAIHRTGGAIIGVIVALIAGNLIGVNALTVTVLVVVAEAVAARLKLNAIGTSQVMVTALLVLTIGGSTSLAYGWSRVAETMVGAVVGVAVNALLVPPSYLGTARSLTLSLVTSLADELEALAAALQRPTTGLTFEVADERLERARVVARQFEDTLAALSRAEESLRFNMRAVRQRDQLEQFQSKVQTLEHTAIQVRSLSRTLYDAILAGDTAWLAPDALGGALGDLVRAAAAVLAAFGSGHDLAQARSEFTRARARFAQRAQTNTALLVPRGWEQVGGALAILERLVDDLSGAAPGEPT